MLIVTVVPVTEVVTFVPPVYVNVPEVVIALPVPESAALVILVTVPPELESAAHEGTPDATFNTCPAEPIFNLDNAVVLEA